MKTIRLIPNVIASLCAALVLCLASQQTQAASANPPGKVTYQGFLTDQNGAPLGASSPVNETVIFRIYTAATGGTLKWAEQQTVTIDNGHFSVLLGEGSASGNEPNAADLTSVFAGADASDRFMQITVGGNIILPRIQYFPAPYAMLAMNARALVDPNGATVLYTHASAVGINKSGTPASALDVNGTITGTGLTINGAASVSGAVTGASFSGSGAGLTGLNASQLITGILPDGRLSGIYGSALTLNNTGNTLSGNGANLTALNANNLASGTVADARLSANVTTAVGLVNGATSGNFANTMVRRDASANIGVHEVWADNLHASGVISADSLTARAMTVTEGVNDILPPYVIEVGNFNNTANWHSAIIPSEIVRKYLAGRRGGRIRVHMAENSTDFQRVIEYMVVIEDSARSGNRTNGRRIAVRNGDYNGDWILNNGSQFAILNTWDWVYVHNYHNENTAPNTRGAAYTDLTLEILTRPNVYATIMLYNF